MFLTAGISIHAPAKGATVPDPYDRYKVPNFNPRSREGSDKISIFAAYGVNNFNPRSREGSD